MKFIYFFALLLSVGLTTARAQSVTRKITLQKGQQLETVANSTMNMSQEMMGQAVEIKTNSTATTLIEVKDVTQGSFIFSNTIKRMVLNTSGMGQDLSFDSDKKEDMEGQIGQQFKGKIGVPQNIVVDKQGKIMEITSTDSSGDLMGVMGGEMTKGASFNLLTVLPLNKVKPGDTWTDSSGTVDVMKTVNTYTLKSVSGKDATIDVVGQVAKKGKMEQMGMELMMDLTGDVIGQSVYDLATGVLKRNTSAMKITGNMEVMGQAVPISMNIKTETSVTGPK